MWTLKKAHRVGELSAAVAVVLSLTFVGYEVRQNSQTQTQMATQEVLRDFANASRLISADDRIACIYLRGNQDYDSLSDLEKFRYSSHLLHNYRAVQEMHSMLQEGSIDLDSWRSIDSIARETLQRPGQRQWLETRRHWFTDEFQSYLEDAISEPATADQVDYNPAGCMSDDL